MLRFARTVTFVGIIFTLLAEPCLAGTANMMRKWAFATGGNVYSSPAIGADGTIYFGSMDNNLYAVYPNGTKRWSFGTGDFFTSSPAIGTDGTIYVGSSYGGLLYAINSDGTKKWSFQANNWVNSPTIGPDGTIYVGSCDNNLYAINPNGTKKWSFKTGEFIWSKPAVGPDGTIYINSEDHNLYAIDSGGNEKWAFAGAYPIFSGPTTSPVVGPDGTIYYASQDNNLYALTPNGAIKWNIEGHYSSPTISPDGTIYTGLGDQLCAIDPDGKMKWTFDTWGWLDYAPAIGADGTIYVASAYGVFYALNPDGTEKCMFTCGFAGSATPTVGADGTVYVGSGQDRSLYAFGETPISMAMSVSSPDLTPERSVTYTINYSNTGSSTATGVVITDKLPDGLSFVPGSATGGGAGDASTITWTIGDLPPGSSGVVSFRANASPVTPGGMIIYNSASIVAAGLQTPLISNSVTLVTPSLVTTHVGVGGAVAPAAPQAIAYDGSLTLTAVPDSGYSVGAWLVDNVVAQTGGTTFTLSNITGSHTIGLMFGVSAPSTKRLGKTQRVSIAGDGTQGTDSSGSASISADGRYVAFESYASNLVPGYSNGMCEIFVHDRLTGRTELISVASDGSQANNESCAPSISADGRYVAFQSSASNLVPGHDSGMREVYVRDRLAGKTEIASVASDGSPANNESCAPSISADGRYVAFASYASNLIFGDTNENYDIFVHDRQTGNTEMISVANDGSLGNDGSGSMYAAPSISVDGRYVAFCSYASNLVPGDSNGACDIFVRDRQTETTEIISVSSDGSQGNSSSGDYYGPSISADGRYVAFTSYASNLATCDATNGSSNVFLHDRRTAMTEMISVARDGSQGNDSSFCQSISADGRYVAFDSLASNLVNGDTNEIADVFLYDRLTRTTERVSVASDGSQVYDGDSYYYRYPSISAGGRYVAFLSDASSLVSDDTNGFTDVFVRDRGNDALIAGLGSDGSVWYTGDLSTWTNVPGKLSTIALGDFAGDGTFGVTGLAQDGSIWYSLDMINLNNLPGHLASLSVGRFNGQKDGIIGLGPDSSIWCTPDLSNWTSLPGHLASLTVGDYNGDGKDEVAGLASDNSVWCMPDMQNWTGANGHLAQLVSGDFDGNGTADLVGVARDSSLWYSLNITSWMDIPGRLSSIVIGDFNGDGKDELVGLASDNSIWHTTDALNWESIPGHLSSLVVGDFNLDGKDDLAGLASDQTVWYSTDLANWNNIPGKLASLYARNK